MGEETACNRTQLRSRIASRGVLAVFQREKQLVPKKATMFGVHTRTLGHEVARLGARVQITNEN